MSSVIRKLRSFWAVPLFGRLWFGPVWIMLGLARLCVLVVPFRRIARFLGTSPDRGYETEVPSRLQDARAIEIGRTIRLSAKYAPWANCFAQALVARTLLRFYGLPYSVFFGVRPSIKGTTGMDAHAWTMSGPISVTGGNGFSDYTVVGTFSG